MIRSAGRTVATAVLGTLAGATWLALIYGSSAALNLEFNVAPPREMARGLYTTERDPTTGTTFVWSSESVTLTLADLDRQVPWTLDVRLRGARAGNQRNPDIDFFVDGTLVHSAATGATYSDVRVAIPSRPAQSGLIVDLRVSDTFVPGPGDPRVLGVMLDRLTVTPDGVVLPPRAAFRGVALASAAAGAALALLNVTAGSAVGGVIVLSAALAALIARGFGPYTDFPAVAATSTIWIGAGTAALAWAVRRWRGQPFRNTARFAIAFSASALLLELLALLHPNMPIGDALFHAHRFQEVLAGRWYFTSTAPGEYQFPYAPGLYVFAIPFSSLVKRGPADMTLLRTIVCVANAAAGLLLYRLAVRIRGDRLAGAIAVALYHLLPLGFGVIATANLTNAFAQALAVAALALMGSPGVRIENRLMVAALSGTLLAAFLSHTSAFAIGAAGASLVAVLFWWRGGPALRSPAAAIAVSAVLAVLLAIALYYAHFLDTYRTELSRIGGETASAAPDAGGRTIGTRLLLVPQYLRGYYGLPAIALAIWGAGLLWQRGARDRVTLTSAGWALACCLFLVLGVLTPVDLRHYLAAIPIVALAGAVAAAIAWPSSIASRSLALVLLAGAALFGIDAWWSTLDPS